MSRGLQRLSAQRLEEDLLVSMHILGVRKLNVSQSSGLDRVPVGGVLDGEGSTHHLQRGPGRLGGPGLDPLDL